MPLALTLAIESLTRVLCSILIRFQLEAEVNSDACVGWERRSFKAAARLPFPS